MELLYIWVRHNGILSNAGFNLDSRFYFEYKEDNENHILAVEILSNDSLREKYINSIDVENKNIKNVTAFVGNNGVGKTTLLKTIHQLSSTKDISKRYGNILVVYYEKDKLKVSYLGENSYQHKIQINITKQEQEEQVTELFDLSGNIPGREKCYHTYNNTEHLMDFIFYSNSMANEISNEYVKNDISTVKLLENKSLDVFFYEEFKRQIDYVMAIRSQEDKEYEQIPFLKKYMTTIINQENANKVISVKMKKATTNEGVGLRIRKSNNDRKNDALIWVIRKLNSIKIYNINYHIKRNVILALLLNEKSRSFLRDKGLLYWKSGYQLLDKMIRNEIYIITRKETNQDVIRILFSDNYTGNNIDQLEEIYKLFLGRYGKHENSKYFNEGLFKDSDLHEDTYEDERCTYMRTSILHAIEQHMSDEEVINSWIEVLMKEGGHLSEFQEYFDFMEYADYLYRMNRNSENNMVDEKINLVFEDAYDLIIKYNRLFIEKINLDFLCFGWQMSSGEAAILNLFSRLYEVKQKIRQKSITILLDEPDLNLHPSLQQDFIYYFYKFINYSFNNHDVSIVLTTHSPIMLSDIPKKNILFLKSDANNRCEIIDIKNEQYSEISETFGGNIYNLFSASFFMEFGSIGTYARENLQSIFNRLKQYPKDEERDEIKKEIELIGEPVLRMQAEMLLQTMRRE